MKTIYWILITNILFFKHVNADECTKNTGSGNAGYRMSFDETEFELQLYLTSKGRPDILLLEHNASSKAVVYIGNGETTFTESRGNFNVSDYTSEKQPLPYFEVSTSTVLRETVCESIIFRLSSSVSSSPVEVTIDLTTNATSDKLSLQVSNLNKGYDRIWVRFSSTPQEEIYGGGEQFSYFNMKGKVFPIWTREQGVGRDKSSNITFMSDTMDGGAGGDYHTTYWPQPLYYSNQLYSVSMTSSKYSVFDFAHDYFNEIEVWESEGFSFDIQVGSTWKELNTKTSDYLLGNYSRPKIPNWIYTGGSILGLQGGTEKVLQLYDQAVQNGVQVNGIWIQDWVGRIETSFGFRLFWDWKLNETQYPGIIEVMQEKELEGVYFMAYINPYLNNQGELFQEAALKGYLVKTKTGMPYVSDFGEFFCGTVDLTDPDAFTWYKGVIKTNLIDIGFKGWMADFGEYLPVDGMVFADGRTGAELHNLWPSLWAKVNREAIEESNMMGEIFVWMRAGHTDSSKYAISAWAGDQNVDWSLDDGLASVIPAALSVGMSGVGISHFDIGGFTSKFGVVRTEQLLLRSAELAVFTPAMRTHEGNRPAENWQVYSDDYTLTRYARLTRLHKLLGNYTESLIKEYYDTGIPVQQPVFYEFPNDVCDNQDYKYQYMYGPDLMVAPIYGEDEYSRRVYFPNEDWISLWDENYRIKKTSGQINSCRSEIINSPMGEPAVFYRGGSSWAESIFSNFQYDRAMPYPRPVSGTRQNKLMPALYTSILILVISCLWI